ncbi:MAG: hypothetical protein A3G18_09100 [Rhodospirillales bacterium RIFCSPLOWO2_12_FULL_58_28]|nr:MAG: hypothetical protein A3H92_10770 [Rhodospirillales bacterium RIFCSPLOWO2_02_FULL_58_16]OHC79217.1 MAG: hypothetical protein A3G18_09100 [Rhodospirillales bacterium RIFCSPLOWO2_12_FULL_58_28]
MINRIKALLRGEGEKGEEAVRLAAAALLSEAACVDGHFVNKERKIITSLLMSRFGLNEAEADTLIEEGMKTADKSTHLCGFTGLIKSRFSHKERVSMVEMLWEVIYADKYLHSYEAKLMCHISELVHISDRESGDARKRVITRMVENS